VIRLSGVVDHGPHLGAEDLVPLRAFEQVVERIDGFMSCTPSCSARVPCRPSGTHHVLLVPQVRAVGTPLTSRSMVCSNKIAARMREPSNAGLVSTRVRMACTRSNISASEL